MSVETLRIVFFGCGEYACPSLDALLAAGLRPDLVVTKPDSPRGRGRKIYPAEVRLHAEQLKLEVAQPSDPHDPEFVAALRKLKPTVGLVISYGVILKPELIGLPDLGMLNAHASLLPAYRGAAPIEFAVRDGVEETGVTIMRIVEELDAGDILLQERTRIGARETSGELRDRLAELSGKAFCRAVEMLKGGKVRFVPQDASKVSYARKIEKPDGVIDWSRPAEQIDRLVRAMTPKPGAQTRLGAKRFIVLEGEIEEDLYGMGVTGAVLSAGEEGIRVCTGKQLYRIVKIKPDNGRTMTAGEFVRGHSIPPDARFT
ncbi:MAG: methionyl-tRNA formyltransferase [Planctomycetota bacterium]